MELKTFIMKNVPQDKEQIRDFVEGTLNDVNVENIEYAGDAALVTLKESIDFGEAEQKLQGQEDCLDDKVGPLKILDPELKNDKIVVDNLDLGYLSLEFLKLYIDSTFNDGYNVVTDCKHIPEIRWTILTLSDLNVVARVLENQDHIPLPSVKYHIQVKPFYQKFHSLLMANLVLEMIPPESYMEGRDNNEERDEVEYDTKARKTDGKEDSTNSVTFQKETLSMQRSTYKLLKDQLKQMDFQKEYDKCKEELTIQSTDAAQSKGEVIDLLRKITVSTKDLTGKDIEFLKKSQVKDIIQNNLSGKENSIFEIDDNSLTISSFGNSVEILDDLTKAVIFTKEIPLPKGFPIEKVRECINNFSSHLFVRDFEDGTITLTGILEDVTIASEDLDKMIENCKCLTKTYKITGTEAMFINKFAMNDLRSICRGAEITENVECDEEISFKYSCPKSQMNDLTKKLNIFEKNIKKYPVDLSDLNKEELVLVGRNSKMDKEHFIDHFQKVHHCCIVLDGLKNTEFFGASASLKSVEKETPGAVASGKTPRSRVPAFHERKKRVIRLSSCKLQIKPFREITKEKTELLVCGIDGSLNLKKTRVSETFLKLDNSLQNQISGYSFSTNGVYVDQRQIPKTKCKGIAFVILQGWKQDTSDQKLKAAVIEVLETANKMGISSISFPPLGVGRAFRFPAHEACQAVITAIDSFWNANPGSSPITLINCLTPDKGLYDEMNKTVDSVFSKDMMDQSVSHGINAPSSHGGDDGDDDDDDDDGDDDDDDDDDKKEVEYETLELQMETSPLSLIIVHNGSKDIVSKFKDELRKSWLHEECFQLDKSICWSPKHTNEVIQHAKALGVYVRIENDPSTKHMNFKIKGNKNDVVKLRQFIEMKATIAKQSKKVLVSSTTPKRGTIDFIKYAADCDDSNPTYWKKSSGQGSKKGFVLTSVDDKTQKAISDIFDYCWDPAQVGRGHDAANIPANTRVKVIKVQRLENNLLFTKYSMKRRAIFKEMADRMQLCTSIDKINGSKGCARTMETLPKYMKKEMYHEINELYLFHGTKSDTIQSICDQGMDSRLSSPSAMFGQGVYLAESSTKSDQYTDSRDNRVAHGTELTMILARVSLGEVFLCDDKHESVQSRTSEKLKRPPCTKCLKDLCTCAAPLFHSVLGDGKWIFREFVVYDNHQCYPEYLITYKRY